jgi:prepilin-type N-terminal cleavage/methylation domain-containing protein
MRHLTVTKNSRQLGFTLIELLVVTLLISIMAAIASPGMLGFVNRSKVSSGHAKLQGALQQIQREAIKRGTDCSLTLPSTTSSTTPIILESTCLITGSETLEDVELRHNVTGNTITFNFKGERTGGDVVIIVTHPDGDAFQKCIAVSQGLGLIRIGNYPGNETGVDISNCTPTS